jgi:SulP family sulfate permease
VLAAVHDVDGFHDVTRHADAQTVPGLVVYRFDASLFFPNATYFRDQVRHLVRETHPRPRWFLLNAEAVTYVDATAIDMLGDLQIELASEGIVLAFAKVKWPIREIFDDAQLTEQVGTQYFFPTVRVAVQEFQRNSPG